jgi:hypothetical protein
MLGVTALRKGFRPEDMKEAEEAEEAGTRLAKAERSGCKMAA